MRAAATTAMWATYLSFVLDGEAWRRVFDVLTGDPYLLRILAAVALGLGWARGSWRRGCRRW